MDIPYLNKAQMQAELEKCLQCQAKPCQKACPAGVSPHDFIKAAKNDDWAGAAEQIARQNPLGEVCGLICPDKFCQKACVRKHIDASIKIPLVQATIMQKARDLKKITEYQKVETLRNVAVIGGGPAGIGAAAELLKQNTAVTVFEKTAQLGGALNYIPAKRLPREIVQYEWQVLQRNPLLSIKLNEQINDACSLMDDGFDGVIVATGTQKIRILGIKGEENATLWSDYLRAPEKFADARNVAIVGGGAVAVDCAITAVQQGAKAVEMFVRRKYSDMRITPHERQQLLDAQINITTMTKPIKIERKNSELLLYTSKTIFNNEGRLVDEPQTLIPRAGFDLIITALGSDSDEEISENQYILYAGDVVNGASTAVEAVASGKKAAQDLLARL